MADDDTTSTTTTEPPEAPHDPPADPPAPTEVTHAVEESADKADEEIPAWGKTLTERFDSLLETLTESAATIADDGVDAVEDTSPVKPPWHKRRLLG